MPDLKELAKLSLDRFNPEGAAGTPAPHDVCRGKPAKAGPLRRVQCGLTRTKALSRRETQSEYDHWALIDVVGVAGSTPAPPAMARGALDPAVLNTRPL